MALKVTQTAVQDSFAYYQISSYWHMVQNQILKYHGFQGTTVIQYFSKMA